MCQSNLQFYEFRLGGVGNTVQIDECLIAKRKYHRVKREKRIKKRVDSDHYELFTCLGK